ncbi:thioredoxin domain-containing protein [Jeotgalibaca arthritidis]|uniref:thioredoxin domain-containing protein n=1 Tax=Jeotgalibaca arthritidis TaxID=1868794 RepID=UPI00359F50BC
MVDPSAVHRIYKEDKIQLADIEKNVKAALDKTIEREKGEGLSKETIDQAYQTLEQRFDPVFGGFGTGQKFPQAQNLLFLLHYYQVTKTKKALYMVEHTLDNMIKGGIWDQLGFGFSRYTVDRRWKTPHFEKMLYDNAMLLMVLASSYQITKKPFYKEKALQLVTFIKSEMTAEEGGFYSAIDADSEGEEGKYYTWTFSEIYDHLDEETADLFVDVYGVSPRGNFEGKNILYLPQLDFSTYAADYGLSEEEIVMTLNQASQSLLAVRKERVYPHLDDKVLTSWNSLMIAALSQAAAVFQDTDMLEMAKKALLFIEEKLYENGRLQARYRQGEAKFHAYLDDYAFLSWAYLSLYEAGADRKHLEKAMATCREMEDLFWDTELGGFFFSGSDSEQMIVQEKEVVEGGLPSGNSIASFVYAKLALMTAHSHYEKRLNELLSIFNTDIKEAPASTPSLMRSLLLTHYPSQQVLVFGKEKARFLEKLQTAYLPNVVTLLADDAADLADLAPYTSDYPNNPGQTMIYVCQNFTCQRPTTDMQEAMAQILEG